MAGPVKYFNTDIAVEPGDLVCRARFFGKPEEGRVNYVPGISPLNADMEFNGLVYVGILMANGKVVATLVDPQTFFLKKSISFRSRDTSPLKLIKAAERFEG